MKVMRNQTNNIIVLLLFLIMSWLFFEVSYSKKENSYKLKLSKRKKKLFEPVPFINLNDVVAEGYRPMPPSGLPKNDKIYGKRISESEVWYYVVNTRDQYVYKDISECRYLSCDFDLDQKLKTNNVFLMSRIDTLGSFRYFVVQNYNTNDFFNCSIKELGDTLELRIEYDYPAWTLINGVLDSKRR